MIRFTSFFSLSVILGLSAFGMLNRPVENSTFDRMPKEEKIRKLKTIKGKIQFVDSFPDYKVQVVDAFPDVKVKKMNAFADDPGEWQIVESFPDYKIQLVDSFPDFKVQWVDSFPGVVE